MVGIRMDINACCTFRVPLRLREVNVEEAGCSRMEGKTLVNINLNRYTSILCNNRQPMSNEFCSVQLTKVFKKGDMLFCVVM
jgi:hypothetical protein